MSTKLNEIFNSLSLLKTELTSVRDEALEKVSESVQNSTQRLK